MYYKVHPSKVFSSVVFNIFRVEHSSLLCNSRTLLSPLKSHYKTQIYNVFCKLGSAKHM